MNYSDDTKSFVVLSDYIEDIILEIRYYTSFNFVGERIDGYHEPIAITTYEAARALKEVNDEMIEKGYRLKIYDAYRPQIAVDHFVRWADDIDDIRMKKYFYPDIDKKDIIPSGYIAKNSGHSRGSTIDLTLFDMKTQKDLDMGGPFDFFGELSHPNYQGITPEQYQNRIILQSAMHKYGFRSIKSEWWHFTLDNEPFPDTYFTFPIDSKLIRRIKKVHI